MKRMISMLSTMAIALPAPFLLSAPAQAQGYRPAVDFCKGDVPNNPPFVLGDCMGFVTTWNNDSQGIVRFICDYLSITDPDLFYEAYDNVPECIRDRANDLPPPPYL